MNALPLWLGLFVYHDLMGGALPLSDLGANVAPALTFVLVECTTHSAILLLLLFIVRRGVKDTVQWFRSILVGFALGFYVPPLFSLAVAVILNRLGLGFFLFIALGLLGTSLMAQRLARSLTSERERVNELTALNAFNEAIIHSPSSVEATSELLFRHIRRFIPDADFELCLFDAEQLARRRVIVGWRYGVAQPATDASLTPLWAQLRDQRQPLYVTDVPQKPLPFTWDEPQHGPRPGSLLLIPLLAADPASPQAERCFGGLLLSHTRLHAFAQVLPSVTALANQLAAALENVRLHQEALAHERLERELTLARGIQTNMLPDGVPHVKGWTFIASLEPARYVSGDFYDFIPLPGDRWGVLIADVADKGMPAALYMALVRTLIRAHAPDHADDPAACLQAVNDQILSDTRTDLFVTVFYSIINPASGRMHFTNAGHNLPYLCRRGEDGAVATPTPLQCGGIALGILPGIRLNNDRAHFAPGDYLVLYTDGITEAHNQELDEFGDGRLLTAITCQDDACVETIHHRVHAAVREFVGDAPQFDDLTLVLVGRQAPAG
jgi:serine phosphatase RsbU (regulator of sigma subunit)